MPCPWLVFGVCESRLGHKFDVPWSRKAQGAEVAFYVWRFGRAMLCPRGQWLLQRSTGDFEAPEKSEGDSAGPAGPNNRAIMFFLFFWACPIPLVCDLGSVDDFFINYPKFQCQWSRLADGGTGARRPFPFYTFAPWHTV